MSDYIEQRKRLEYRFSLPEGHEDYLSREGLFDIAEHLFVTLAQVEADHEAREEAIYRRGKMYMKAVTVAMLTRRIEDAFRTDATLEFSAAVRLQNDLIAFDGKGLYEPFEPDTRIHSAAELEEMQGKLRQTLQERLKGIQARQEELMKQLPRNNGDTGRP